MPPKQPKAKPVQNRSERNHKLVTVALPLEYLDKLARIEAAAPGVDNRSATIRYLIDREIDRLETENRK